MGQLFRRAHGHHLPAARSPLGAHVDQPVGGFDHIQIVLNDHHGVARIHELVQHLQQQVDVGKVQARGGFIQNVKRAPGVAFGQLQRQLHPLCFAPRQGGGGLPQADVAQAHIGQGLQLAVQHGHSGKHIQSAVNRQVEHLGNVQPFVTNFQRLAVVALAMAHVAGHIHIGQEVHFHPHHAIALAGLTTAAGHVE